jgi:hypothetical protein
MPDIGNGRPLRVCDLCGGVDDHPRHVIASGGRDVFPAPSDEIVSRVLDSAPAEHRARLLRELQDTSSSDRHMDCCREAGCPDPDNNCAALTEGAEQARGAKLLKHLTREV